VRTVNQPTQPTQTARTAIPLSGALLLLTHAAAVVWLLAALPPLGLAAGALLLWPIASDWAASKVSDHVVYMLYNDADVIYVGETDDVYRRMYQHTDGIEHTWWRDIDGYNIARDAS